MATRSPERRQHTERRRRGDRASDLYQRLEEKRKQFERRQQMRREADRVGDAEKPPPLREKPEPGQPADPAVAGELGNGGK